MKLPSSLGWLRETRPWRRVQDWRMLRRQQPHRRFLAQLLAHDARVFDIGANLGHKSLLYLAMGARVVAVEPQAALVARLRQRFGSHPRLTILHSALGAAAGQLTLHKCSTESAIASLRDDYAARSRFSATHRFDASETVPVRTLDDLRSEFGAPAFCKIDVEGYECAVLEGLSSPAGVISFEFNREFLDDTRRCVARLTALGYRRFNACLGETPAWFCPEPLSSEALLDRLAAQPDPLLWGDVYALP